MSPNPELGALRMSCQDAKCEAERDGWVTILDPNDAKHASAARWIMGDQGRKYIHLRSEDALEYVANHADTLGFTADVPKLTGILERTPPGMLVFIFEPGQPCFRPHVDRAVIFTHMTPRGDVRTHERPVDWNEHVNIEADRVHVLRQRG